MRAHFLLPALNLALGVGLGLTLGAYLGARLPAGAPAAPAVPAERVAPVPAAPAAAPAGAPPPEAALQPVPARAWVRDATGDVTHLVLEEGRLRPGTITVPEGDQVRLLVSNHSRRPRNLVIPDYRVVGMTLAPGEENYIEFTADRKGDFPVYSDAARPGQPEPGMRAVLRVR